MDKLSVFFTETKGSWGVGLRGRVHSPLGPICPCGLSWRYCELEKDKHVCSHLGQPPDTWVMGEDGWVTLGPGRTGHEAPLQSTQELLPLSLPSPAAPRFLTCPGTAGLETPPTTCLCSMPILEAFRDL